MVRNAVKNLITMLCSPLNWFVGEIWKYLELWAREALEGFKQSFMNNSGSSVDIEGQAP